MKFKAVALFGPTASGKTGLAIALARRFGAEIINMDSVQVYRGLDIGSAKPTPEEQKQAVHHLIDGTNPEEEWNSFKIFCLALEAGKEIVSRRRLPLFAGGTGLYFKALFEGMFEGPDRSSEIRSRLKKEKEEKGLEMLYEELRQADPEAAAKINPNDYVRIERALEVYRITGKPISHFWGKQKYEPPFKFLKIGITYPRPLLYERIEKRVNEMLEKGLIEETEKLLSLYPQSRILRRAIGYREAADFLEGRLNREQMEALLKRNTRRFARRQITLFKALDGVEWFSPPEEGKIIELVEAFLKGGKR